MADLKKRITSLTEKTTLTSGDFIAVDNVSGGTKKYNYYADKTALDQAVEDIDTIEGDVADLKSDLAEYEGIFTADVDESISNWLDAHPEATTTVQDHSLTYEKLVTGTLGFVTPEMFNAKGDGLTDDTQSIINVLDYCRINDCSVMFETGKVYAVSQILITNRQSINFNGCVLKALTTDAPLKLNQTNFNILPSGDIKNVTIDMNNVANIGYHVAQWWRGNHENIAVINPPINGTGILLDGASAGNLFSTIKGVGNTNGKSLFIDIEAADNTFNNIDWKQFVEGIYCGRFTVLHNVHGFVTGDDLYPNSYFMRIARGVQASNLYPDTQQYALFFSDNNIPSIIDNVSFVFNSSAVSAEVINENVPYGVYAVESYYKNTRRVIINNVSIETDIYNENGLFNYKDIQITVKNVTCISGCVYIAPKHKLNKNSIVTYASAPDGTTEYPFCDNEMYVDAITATADVVAFTALVSKGTTNYYAFKKGYYNAVTELNSVRSAVLVRVNDNRQLMCLSALSTGTVLYVSIPVEQMISA